MWSLHALKGKWLNTWIPSIPVWNSPTKWGHLYKVGRPNLIRHPVLKHLHWSLWGNTKCHTGSLQKKLTGVYKDSNFFFFFFQRNNIFLLNNRIFLFILGFSSCLFKVWYFSSQEAFLFISVASLMRVSTGLSTKRKNHQQIKAGVGCELALTTAGEGCLCGYRHMVLLQLSWPPQIWLRC